MLETTGPDARSSVAATQRSDDESRPRRSTPGRGRNTLERSAAREAGKLTWPASCPQDPSDAFATERVRWLVRLRWGAIAGMLGTTLAGALGWLGPVHVPLLVAVTIGAATFNTALALRTAHGPRDGVLHAFADMGILTLFLWALGGVHTPFLANYIFHVAIVGILGGPRATGVAAGAALSGSGLLALSEHVPWVHLARWAPIAPFDVISEALAFASVVGAVAYLVSRAVGELKLREEALARLGDQVALEYEVLSNTLSELEVGLEVVDAEGRISFRNKLAHDLAEHVREASADESVRFAARGPDGEERLYERLVFPLERGARVMHLYLDRSTTVEDEGRLVLAERLASLGRVAQGVAHELNTPLATIRTLAADMHAALEAVEREGGDHRVVDARESAQLVHEETLRLGRITQDLLTRGDLARSHPVGDVPLHAVVSRAIALVFAGTRGAPPVELGSGIEHFAARADSDGLVQILVNLLQNAHDAMRAEPRIGARIRIDAETSGEHLVVRVEDEGPGLAESVEARLFEPFATTKPPGEGTGLGLYVSRRLARRMGGELRVLPRTPHGVRAELEVPRAGTDGEPVIASVPSPSIAPRATRAVHHA